MGDAVLLAVVKRAVVGVVRCRSRILRATPFVLLNLNLASVLGERCDARVVGGASGLLRVQV